MKVLAVDLFMKTTIMFRFIAFVFCTILFNWMSNFPLLAQHQITGQVFSEDGKPTAFATVSIYSLADSSNIKGVITDDKNGQFLITDLATANYQLVVQMLGYEDWEQSVFISENVDIGNIVLKETSTQLAAIEINADYSSVESKLGKKILHIGQDLSSTGSNALEALETIPSVNTSNKGQVEIRGNSNVIIYINGKETKRDPTTLKYVAAESLSRIELITNPSAKYDAEGIAGIINLVYKKDNTTEFKLEAISNMAVLTNPINLNPSGGLNVSFTKNKFSVFTNASIEHGPYEDHFNTQRIHFTDSLSIYQNKIIQQGIGQVANFNMGISFEPDTTLLMSLEVNFDCWDFEDEQQQNNSFQYNNNSYNTLNLLAEQGELENELWLNWAIEKTFASKYQLNISLTAGGENEDNFYRSQTLSLSEHPSLVEQFLLNSNEIEQQRYYQGKIDFTAPFFQLGTLEAGIKTDFIQYNILQKVNLQSSTIPPPNNDFSMDMQKLGMYFLQSHQIKKFAYSLGLRLEQFAGKGIQHTNEQEFTQQYFKAFPSLQLSYWLPNENHTIGFN